MDKQISKQSTRSNSGLATIPLACAKNHMVNKQVLQTSLGYFDSKAVH